MQDLVVDYPQQGFTVVTATTSWLGAPYVPLYIINNDSLIMSYIKVERHLLT